jgi:hypothetical protein
MKEKLQSTKSNGALTLSLLSKPVKNLFTEQESKGEKVLLLIILVNTLHRIFQHASLVFTHFTLGRASQKWAFCCFSESPRSGL